MKWNETNVELEALKYNRRIEFKRNARGAYAYACKYKLLDEICKHMKQHDYSLNFKKIEPNSEIIQPRVFKTIWNYDLCKKEALKYKRRVDFRDGSPGAYYYALKNNISDEICKHMQTNPQNKKPKKKQTFQDRRQSKINNLHLIASKYNKLKDFRENDYNAYYSSKSLGVFKEITAHMRKMKHIENEYSFEECVNSAINKRNIGDFKNKCYNQYKYAESKHWIDQISLILNLNRLIDKNNNYIQNLEVLNTSLNSQIEINNHKLDSFKTINENTQKTIENIFSLNNGKYVDIEYGN